MPAKTEDFNKVQSRLTELFNVHDATKNPYAKNQEDLKLNNLKKKCN